MSFRVYDDRHYCHDGFNVIRSQPECDNPCLTTSTDSVPPPPEPSGGQTNILVINTDIQVSVGETIPFTLGSLGDFEQILNGYRYKGEKKDIVMIATNIQYKSLTKSIPYEIVTLAIMVNGVLNVKRKYGLDMQERIKDEYLLDLKPNDLVEFMLVAIQFNSENKVTVENKSFITLRSLQLHNASVEKLQ